MLARCEVAVIGGDGGGLDDLFGICVLGRDKLTKVWLYWVHAFAHRKVLELRRDIAPKLLDFEKSGDLTFWGQPGAATMPVAAWLAASDEAESAVERPEDGSDEDVAAIVTICKRVRKLGLLPEDNGIGVDPAVIGTLVDALVKAKFEIGNPSSGKGDIFAVSQSVVNMFSAINTLERKLEAGTAAHGGTALMDWCVGNAKAVRRGNSVAITKAEAGSAKIDPLVACFVATKLMERNPEAAGDDNGGIAAWVESLKPVAKAA
jgi:phage terminase large subunit-like protein